MKPAELEMITQCKLLLSDVALQRHHASIAVNMTFSALKLLRSSDTFKDKRSKKQNATRYRLVQRHVCVCVCELCTRQCVGVLKRESLF